MQDFIFDFGNLESSTEYLYIQSMVANTRFNVVLVKDEQLIITNLIHRSQVFHSQDTSISISYIVFSLRYIYEIQREIPVWCHCEM